MYNYTIKKSDDYEVLLKPNEFYTNEALPSNLYYPGRAVDDYVISFIYDFKANEKRHLDYSYNITAELVGIVESSDGRDKEVWNRDFNILENKPMSLDGDNILINEKVNIDYDYYNNLVRSYKETYGLEINSILKVKFNIDFPEIELKDEIELDIDITDDVTSLDENYEKTITNLTPETPNKISGSKITFSIIGVLIILFMIYEIIKINRRKTPEEKYKRNIKYILKFYEDLVVTTGNKPNLESLKIIKIMSLEDLVKISEQNRKNIILYEEVKNKKSKLYVIVDNYCYMYNVTGEKLK